MLSLIGLVVVKIACVKRNGKLILIAAFPDG